MTRFLSLLLLLAPLLSHSQPITLRESGGNLQYKVGTGTYRWGSKVRSIGTGLALLNGKLDLDLPNVDYNLLGNRPVLGTGAAFNVPATGNATTNQLVLGSDGRLSNARTPTAHGHVSRDLFGVAGAVANGVVNDSARIMEEFAFTNEVTLKPGLTYAISRIVINPGKTLRIPRGTTLRLLPLNDQQRAFFGTEFGGVEIKGGGSLTGEGVIDGNKPARADGYGVYFANVFSGGVSVDGISIINTPHDAMRFQAVSGGVNLVNLKITGCEDRSIHGITTDDVKITALYARGGTHSVQWWGDLTHGYCKRWTITDANVGDVAGAGIWGYKGESITVQGGSAVRCGDICYDAEDTHNSSFTGVYAEDGVNSAYGIYNGCTNIEFVGVSAKQGVGKGPAVKFYAPNAAGAGINSGITFTGGNLTTQPNAPVINSDQGVVENVTFNGVRMSGAYAQILDGNRINFVNNILSTTGDLGLWLLGTTNSLVSGNSFYHIGAPIAGNEVRVTYRSSTFNGGGNRIENNHAYGFLNGCWDDANGSPMPNSGNIFRGNETGAIVQNGGYSLRRSGNYLSNGTQLEESRTELSALSLADPVYYKLLTIPASTGGTFDNSVMAVTLGGWAGIAKKRLTMGIGGRDGLSVHSVCLGDNGAAGHVAAYQQTDGSIVFYASLAPFNQITVDYQQITQSRAESSLVAVSAPTGTMVYSSVNGVNAEFMSDSRIRTLGDFEVTRPDAGLILKSPNGTRYRVTIGDNGTLTTTAL